MSQIPNLRDSVSEDRVEERNENNATSNPTSPSTSHSNLNAISNPENQMVLQNISQIYRTFQMELDVDVYAIRNNDENYTIGFRMNNESLENQGQENQEVDEREHNGEDNGEDNEEEYNEEEYNEETNGENEVQFNILNGVIERQERDYSRDPIYNNTRPLNSFQIQFHYGGGSLQNDISAPLNIPVDVQFLNNILLPISRDNVLEQIINQSFNEYQPVQNPLSDEKIAQLPERKIEETKINENCSICLENFAIEKQIIELGCHHFFHSCCIKTWLKENAVCPHCRKGV